jgi:hypothetical protein
MKKWLPYIIVLVVLILLAFLIGGRSRNFNTRITLNRKDKNPYGCYVAYSNLPYVFPFAHMMVNREAPGFWEDSVLTADTNHQVLVIVTKEFNADEEELEELFHFVAKGNDVLISSNSFSRDAEDFFHFTRGNNFFLDYGVGREPQEDTLRLSLMQPPFRDRELAYMYPGTRFSGHFSIFDTAMCYILGRTMDSLSAFESGRSVDSLPMFLRFSAGAGSFYVQSAPLAFSNFFLLYRKNMDYYSQVMSALDGSARRVAWDEYYIRKPKAMSKPSSPLRVLLDQPAFSWALGLVLVGLLIFVFLGIKRRQRMIPFFQRPQNDSLDFVKTVGRLYYQKKDNRNLCLKMSAYFTEHVYSRFKLHTGNLDQEFVKMLVQKSGCDEKTVQQIVDYVQFIPEAPAIHDQQTVEFYQLLEKFYKST